MGTDFTTLALNTRAEISMLERGRLSGEYKDHGGPIRHEREKQGKVMAFYYQRRGPNLTKAHPRMRRGFTAEENKKLFQGFILEGLTTRRSCVPKTDT